MPKVLSNLIWRLLERSGAQIVTFVVSIVLARLLDPIVYGTVALVTVITAILQVFVDSGLGNALIQKKNADDTDFSTVFYFNILVCAVLYTALFFAAPFIAKFYEMPELTPVIRVLGTILIISGVKNVQQAYVSKHLLFKRFFWATLGGTLCAAGVGIWMAYEGYGVWALVAQYLVNAAMDTIILWITVKFRPKLTFSWKRLGGLFKYGWKLLVSALFDTGYTELRSLIIGKKYSSEDLAFYNKGNQFPKVIAGTVNTSIDSVLLPVMSKEQDNSERIKMMTRRAIKTSSFVLWPMMMGLAACAEPIVSLLLTDKWRPCVLFMRVFCITYAFYPIHTANLNAIKAMGRSDLFLILEIIKKVIGLGLILGFMWISVEAMAYSCIISSICSQIINSWPNKKLLKYSYLEQIKDTLPSIGLSLFMAGCVYCVGFLHLNNWLTLLIQVPLGAIIYILGAKIFKFEAFGYLLSTAKGFFKKRKILSEQKTEKKVKKLMILGGSRYILPVIEKAHELGIYVITCDYLPDNIAHKYSDEYCNISIIDKDAVLAKAQELKIDGIMSFACDPGVTTMAYVAEKMGLPSCGSYEAISILQNKGKFRKFLTENGFNVPLAKSYKDTEKALAEIDKFKFPIIVKPTDSAGSKGVKRVDCVDELESAINNALASSLSGEFIIEEFLEQKGFSSDSDCFSIDGKMVFYSFSSQRFDKECENPYTPSAYSWPSSISEEHQTELKNELQRLISLLGLKTSIYNIETREAVDGKAYIMEVSPRGGGNRLAEIVRIATGVDMIEEYIKYCVGMPLSGIKQEPYKKNMAEIILHSEVEGIFDSLWISEEIEAYVVEKDLWIKSGTKVGGFKGANEAVGTLVLAFDNQEELERVLENQKDYIKVLLKNQ